MRHPNLLPGGRPRRGPRGAQGGRGGLARRRPARHARAATRRRSSPPRPTGRSAHCSSAASSSTTCPIPPAHWPPSTPRRVRGEPGVAPQRRHRPRRRGVPRRTGHREGGHVRQLGRRLRPFEPALPPNATADVRVLAALADEVGVDLALRDAATVRAEHARIGSWQGTRAAAPDVAPADAGGSVGGPRRADRVADAAGRGPAAGRRAASGRHGPAGRRAPVASPPPPKSARPTANSSPSAPRAARSRCRSRSPTCPTASCGCR